jgi:hypothetical protein
MQLGDNVVIQLILAFALLSACSGASKNGLKEILAELESDPSAKDTEVKLYLLEHQFLPDELEAELERIPEAEKGKEFLLGKELLLSKARYHSALRTQIGILHYTQNPQLLAQNILKGNPPEDEMRECWEELGNTGKISATEETVLKIVSKFEKVSEEYLENALEPIATIIAYLPPDNQREIKNALEPDTIDGPKATNIKSELIKSLEAHAIKRAEEYFTRRIAFKSVDEIKEKLEKLPKPNLIPSLGKASVNFLLNHAYLAKSEGKIAETRALLAAAIQKQTTATATATAKKKNRRPHPGLIQYYRGLKSEEFPLSMDEPVAITKEEMTELKKAVNEFVKREAATEEALWAVEKAAGVSKKIQELLKKPADDNEIKKLVQKVVDSNKEEAERKPTKFHPPKYWINSYYGCMVNENQHNCEAYLCAAHQMDSPLRELTGHHCFEFVRKFKEHTIPSPLPGEGREKRHLYFVLQLEAEHISENKAFLAEFVEKAGEKIKPTKTV